MTLNRIGKKMLDPLLSNKWIGGGADGEVEVKGHI